MNTFPIFSLFLFIALTFGMAVDSAAQKNPLAKTVWTIESYGAADNQQAVEIISQEDDHFPSINFNADGRSGYIAGCNSISFTYTVKKGNLSVKTKSSTMKACPAELMKQDHEIIFALGKADSFKINGNNFQINYDNGKIMQLKRLV